MADLPPEFDLSDDIRRHQVKIDAASDRGKASFEVRQPLIVNPYTFHDERFAFDQAWVRACIAEALDAESGN